MQRGAGIVPAAGNGDRQMRLSPRRRAGQTRSRAAGRVAAGLTAGVLWLASAGAGEAPAPAAMPAPVPRPADLVPEPPPVTEICRLIGASAAAHALPPDFFARLIWRESRFDVRAVSPVGAQGIAQFMPRTADERGLENPWDPAQAIPASADYLAALRGDFGNLGLAAAAYNAGPDRVARFLRRGVRLPWETVRYVRAITGRPVEWFRSPGREVEPRPLHPEKSFDEACADLPVMRTRAAPRPPWGVQVASGVSPAAARRAWSRIRRSHQGALRGAHAHVMRSGLRVGARYVVRLGAQSRAEAGRLCARLRRSGGACVVMRN